MGFRHFDGFYIALLRKQGWKLLTNQDAIVTKIFKAKYFSNENFLEARLVYNPSFVWRRSIHTSQVLITRGMRWNIGNGSDINIWKEPWVRREGDCHVS